MKVEILGAEYEILWVDKENLSKDIESEIIDECVVSGFDKTIEIGCTNNEERTRFIERIAIIKAFLVESGVANIYVSDLMWFAQMLPKINESLNLKPPEDDIAEEIMPMPTIINPNPTTALF